MVGMTAVAVVAAIAVVGAVVARVTWRRPADERHSIESHQQTLDTLRAMADRRPPGQRERVPGSTSDHRSGSGDDARPTRARTGPAHAGPVRSGPVPSASERSAPARSAPGRPVRAPATGANGAADANDLVFVDDTSPASTPRPDASLRSPLALPGLPRTGRGHRRHAGPRRRSGSRLFPLVGAVVVLGLVIGVAVALTPSHPRASATHHSTKKPKSSVRTTEPRTTVPPPPKVQPTSSTAVTADYAAPSTGYTLTLQATGPCWVEATTTATGALVWTGTLAPGQVRSIPATGSLLLRLGASNDVSVTLNGEPVVYPAGFQSPFDMTFQAT
jgi:hypothetical protein